MSNRNYYSIPDKSFMFHGRLQEDCLTKFNSIYNCMPKISKSDHYATECLRLLVEHHNSIAPVFSDPYCELEYTFLGFLESYVDIAKLGYKNKTIVDLGCGPAVQALYFTEFENYIGIDSYTEPKYRVKTKNSTHLKMSIQDFVTDNPLNLEFNDCIAIMSYVPDDLARDLVINKFPFAKVVYCSTVYKNTAY